MSTTAPTLNAAPVNDTAASRTDAPQSTPAVWRSRITTVAWGLLWIPAAIPWLLMLAYIFQPDALASVTVFPTWCWCLLGSQLTGPMLATRRHLSFPTAIIGWVLFALFFVAEWRGLLWARFDPPEVPADALRLRIVSINTGPGRSLIFRDLEDLDPDLVLLQESPPAYLLPQLAAQLWNGQSHVVAGFDCSIISRQPLRPISIPEQSAFQRALWEPVSGLRVHVFSLRLSGVPVDLTFWDAQARQTYREVRQRHARELQPLVEALDVIGTHEPVIVGGDFNCPAGDRTEWPLRQWMRDAFRQQGRGLGNTYSDRFPFHRIDRIWMSEELVPVNVVARRAKFSDHWLVVCDLYIPRDRLPRTSE